MLQREATSAEAAAGISLPSDLMIAYDGAVELATDALGAAGLISGGGPCTGVWATVQNLLEIVSMTHNSARVAILGVASELAAGRQIRGPARFGVIVRATAHEVALALSSEIDQRIRSAVMAAGASIDQAEPASLLLFFGNSKTPMDLNFLRRHFSTWRRHFNGGGLPSSDEVIAEIGIEAGVAAAARCAASRRLAAAAAPDGAASHAAKRKRRRRRRASVKILAPLTAKQVEAMQLVGEHKGDYTAAGAAAGKSRQAMKKLHEIACKKLGRKGVEKAAKTQPLPTDRRGQSKVIDPRVADPDALDSNNE
jgi:hypothetical protein